MGYENAYYQYRSGLLDEDRWHFYRDQLASPVQQRCTGVHAVVGDQHSTPWTPEFVALVEEILAEEPDRGE